MMLNKFERTLDITKQNFNEYYAYFPVELESYIGGEGENWHFTDSFTCISSF